MDFDLVSTDLPSEDEVVIYNPLKHPFTYHCALGGYDNDYTIPSYEGVKLPRVVADHLAKHLKDEIVGQKRGVITEKEVEEAYNLIYQR